MNRAARFRMMVMVGMVMIGRMIHGQMYPVYLVRALTQMRIEHWLKTRAKRPEYAEYAHALAAKKAETAERSGTLESLRVVGCPPVD
jgi:hypothetical protein